MPTMNNEPPHYLSEFSDTIKNLDWTLDDKPELVPARAHILLKFKVNNHSFLYRRAKLSPQQIQRQLFACQIMGDIVSKVHFADKYCIIQDYIEGQIVTPNSSDIAWEKLGELLSKIHENPCSGFGPLVSTTDGSYSTHYNFIYPDLASLLIIHRAKILSSTELNKLENYLLSPPESASPHTVVCHSDVWPPNIIFNPETQNLGLIDWEKVSSNYPEYDFLGFANISHPNSTKIYNTILKNYQHNLNQDLINYYIVLLTTSRFNSLDNPHIESLTAKIQSLKPHFLK